MLICLISNEDDGHLIKAFVPHATQPINVRRISNVASITRTKTSTNKKRGGGSRIALRVAIDEQQIHRSHVRCAFYV